MTIETASFRIVPAMLLATLAVTAPASADLGAARGFAVLSAGHLGFSSLDTVAPVLNPIAATCPAGAGCTTFVGGSKVSKGSNDRIYAQATTSVSDAGSALTVYAAFLGGLKPSSTLMPIALKPGSGLMLRTAPGLNVVATPSIVAGSANPMASDPCANQTGSPATITIVGGTTTSVVFNVGTTSRPGSLILCNGSRIQLTGGLMPDHVIFNVAGASRMIALGSSTLLDGTLLAAQQGFFSENTSPQAPPTVVNGALLFGGPATIGSNLIVNFYPLEQIGVPTSAKMKGTVDIRTLPAPAKRSADTESDEFLPGPRLQVPVRSVVRSIVPSTLKMRNLNAGAQKGPALTVNRTFTGLSQNGKTPSDTQFAAGTTRLLQMVNTTGAFYTNPGGTLVKTFDLGKFFIAPVGSGSDPRVYFDATTSPGTFFAAYELVPPGGDEIDLSVSSDPGNVWTDYIIASNSAGILFDQPKLGVGSDKIILSWNEYKNCVVKGKATKCGIGTDYAVVAKSGILNRSTSVPTVTWIEDTSRFQIIPANSLSGDGGVQQAAYHLNGSSTFDLMSFSGIPGVNAVTFNDAGFGIGASSFPPGARQPAGGVPAINTNDDRLLSTVYQNGVLWGNFNEACTPAGDSTPRACERFVEISAGLRGFTGVFQNASLRSPGQDIYYSAVSLAAPTDSAPQGDLFFGFTLSSPKLDPAAYVAVVPKGVFGPQVGVAQSVAGAVPFNDFATPTRWGDYTAAARDPNDPSEIWLVNQFGGLKPSQLWGTSITQVQL